jgi:hypothetical protein
MSQAAIPRSHEEYFSALQQRELFASAGYVEIEILEEPTRGWICCIGKKPNAPPLAEGLPDSRLHCQ